MRETVIAVRHGKGGTPRDLIALTLDLEQYDDAWVATALELGVSTFADTLDEVRRDLADAVILQLNEVDRLGFIDVYLREQGVRVLDLSTPTSTSPEPAEKWAMASAGS